MSLACRAIASNKHQGAVVLRTSGGRLDEAGVKLDLIVKAGPKRHNFQGLGKG